MSEVSFGAIKPFKAGTVNRFDIPWGDYLAASFGEGAGYSLGAAAVNWAEMFDDGTEKLEPEQLLKEYKVDGLNWDRPFTRKQAEAIVARHQDEARRNFILDQGTTGIGRVASRFAANLLGNMSNPVDLAVTLVPLFGSSAKAKAFGESAEISARVLGRLSRGLIASEESLAQYGLRSKLGVRMLEGGLNNALVEPLIAADRLRAQFDYTTDDFLMNTAFGAAAGGGLHLLGVGLGKVIDAITPPMKEEISKRMLTDALLGKENIDGPNQLIRVDENYLAMVRAETEATVRANTEYAARVEGVEAQVRAEFEAKKQPVDEAEVRRIVEERVAAKGEFAEAKTPEEAVEKVREAFSSGELNTKSLDRLIGAAEGKYKTTLYNSARAALEGNPNNLPALYVTSRAALSPDIELAGNIKRYEAALRDAPEGASVRSELEATAARTQEQAIAAEVQRIKSELEANKPEAVRARTNELVAEAMRARGLTDEQIAKYKAASPTEAAKAMDADIENGRMTAKDIQAKEAAEGSESPIAGFYRDEIESIREYEKQMNALYGDNGLKMRETLMKAAPCVIQNG